jgi:hypothetical protein
MFWVLGFIPGYILSWVLKKLNLLRVPREVELAGLDHSSVSVVIREDDDIRGVLALEGRATASK